MTRNLPSGAISLSDKGPQSRLFNEEGRCSAWPVLVQPNCASFFGNFGRFI